jgi:hypothetical protein
LAFSLFVVFGVLGRTGTLIDVFSSKKELALPIQGIKLSAFLTIE